MLKAEQTDYNMGSYKKGFIEHTQREIMKFKEHIKQEYENYVNDGPGADHISLSEGLQKLEEYKDLVQKMNRQKEDKVLAEKLFNLPISKYDELIAMD